MKIEDLEIEKQEVLNLQQDFYNKLFERFKEYEAELNRYKEKLNLTNKEINRLKSEVEIYKEEKERNRDIIEKLRYEITKLEDEIYQLKYNDKNNKIEIIEDLKEAFIDNNEEEIEELIDEILEDIINIEGILKIEDIIFLMYICYFIDRLKVLLSKSQIANIVYTENSNESKLLNILVQEESSKIYSIIEDCARSYINKETSLFSKLEKEVSQRLKETLEDFSYESFEEVYASSEIKQDDKVVLIKAWARHKDSMSWKLVSGLYSVANNNLYLEKNMIDILGLKEGQLEVEESQISNLYDQKEELYKKTKGNITYHINSIKNSFLCEKLEKIKKLMRSKKNSKELDMFEDILSFDINENNITKKEAYTLLLIALFYGAHKKLITKSSYLKELYESQDLEGKMLKIIERELTISPGFKIDLPIRVFVEKNKDTLIYIDTDVKIKIMELINIYFNKEFKKIVVSDKKYKNSISASKNSVVKMGYIKLINEHGDSKYLLCQDTSTDECNTVYIVNKKYEKINTMLNGYIIDNNNLKIVDKSLSINISEDSKQPNTNTDSLYKDFDCGNLNTESDIRKLGYSTSVSREERWRILRDKAIPKLGKNKVVGHIKFLVKMNRGRKTMANAVNEWMYDLDRLDRL